MKSLILLLLLLSGCGYQFSGGQLPGDIRLLYLPLAANRTAEPLLENKLAGPVTAVLARQKGVELVASESHADAVLNGTISRYSVIPISYDANDRISVLQATMVVRYQLVQQRDGKLLWQGDLMRQETYNAVVDKNAQEDLESIAIEMLAKNIADDLLSRLVNRF
ncbi:LPS assembly lipoprotein LptE [Geopsychrobacter electrodiphilus]|uniref:LPS assembly lipoprotein LptE n=1 Tax=Geopsychrobacter electrodiphilus TaxID=225196 RepID=UPI000374A3A7|nr:LPS assembly lipoprotein LptE [Geopsychrobacter electrodiphilus]